MDNLGNATSSTTQGEAPKARQGKTPTTSKQLSTLIIRPHSWEECPVELLGQFFYAMPLQFAVNFGLTCTKLQKLVWHVMLNGPGRIKAEETAVPFMRVFQDDPSFRPDHLVPIDQRGIDWIQKTLGINCGPVTLQKIRGRELTIKAAKERLANPAPIWAELKRVFEASEFYQQINNNNSKRLKEYQILCRFMEDPDTYYQDKDSFPFFHEAEVDKAVTKYILDGSLSITEYLRFDKYPSNVGDFASPFWFLDDELIQTNLDNEKLKLQTLISKKSLCDVGHSWENYNGNEPVGSPILRLKQNDSIMELLKNKKVTHKQLIDIANENKKYKCKFQNSTEDHYFDFVYFLQNNKYLLELTTIDELFQVSDSVILYLSAHRVKLKPAFENKQVSFQDVVNHVDNRYSKKESNCTII